MTTEMIRHYLTVDVRIGAGKLSQSGDGKIVRGGAQFARGDDCSSAAIHGIAKCSDDGRLIIVQDADSLHRPAQPGDGFCQPEAVRVLDLTDQELFPDAEDLDRRGIARFVQGWTVQAASPLSQYPAV